MCLCLFHVCYADWLTPLCLPLLSVQTRAETLLAVDDMIEAVIQVG